MKRILTLLVAMSMVLGAAAQASAVEFSASGHFHTVFGAQKDLTDFDDDTSEDTFFAGSRIRAKLQVKASENIKGVWEVQVGNWDWGSLDNPNGARLDSNMQDFKTRLAYVSWSIPKTTATVNMGIQQLSLPSAAFGNPIFDARVAGVTAGGAIADGIALTGFWARPYDNDNGASNVNHNSIDMFGAIADLDLGSAKISPYLAYVKVGHDTLPAGGPAWASGNTDEDTNLYIGGAAIELNLMEALSIKFDGMYADAKNDTDGAYETNGYLFAGALDYSLPFGTPGVFGWYSSGADKHGEGVMPVLGTDGGFAPTTIGFMGTTSLGFDTAISGTGVGTWGVGLALADLSFLEKLTHEFRVAYVCGTNDKDYITSPIGNMNTGLNEKDSFFEIDFNSQYDIMENWVAVLELAYIMPSFDQKAGGARVTPDDNAYIGQMYFLYNF